MRIEIYKRQNEYEKMAKKIYYMFDDCICIFEWGEMIENMLGHGFTKITFDRDLENVNYRKLIIEEF